MAVAPKVTSPGSMRAPAAHLGLVSEVAAARKHLDRALELAEKGVGAPQAAKALYAEDGISPREALAGADRTERTSRGRLHSLLLSDPPAAMETLVEAAAAAAWPLPERIRAGVAELPAEMGRSVTPSRVVCGRASRGRCVLFVEDDDEAEVWLDRTADALKLERPLIVSASSSVDRAGYAAARALALSDLVHADRSGNSCRWCATKATRSQCSSPSTTSSHGPFPIACWVRS